MRTRNDDSGGWPGVCFRASAPERGLFAPGREIYLSGPRKGCRGAVVKPTFGFWRVGVCLIGLRYLLGAYAAVASSSVAAHAYVMKASKWLSLK